jgi:hypothetical protein
VVSGGGALHGFEVAGRDSRFAPATAVLAGATVRVSLDAVKVPVYVRYGWSNFPEPEANLVNRAGLPAASFSTEMSAECYVRNVPPGKMPASVGTAIARLPRIAVLNDNIAGLDHQRVRTAVAGLREAGFRVCELDCAGLASPASFNRNHYDSLILTDSPYFPGVAKDNLLTFLKAGGNLVTLGGVAFENPVYRLGAQWVSLAQWQEAVRKLPGQHVQFSFDRDGLASWHRATNKPEHPSRIELARGVVGRSMHISLKDCGPWQWDVYSVAVPNGFSQGDNVFSFWAKGGELTPQVHIGIDEQDGTRWYAVVELESQWRQHLLAPQQFKLLDTPAKGRGGKDDAPRLHAVRRISFGLAASHGAFPRGDHQIWIDEVGSVKAPLPEAFDLNAKVELNAFFDYDEYRLRGLSAVRPAAGQELVAKDFALDGDLAGVSAVGFALAGKSRFIPLLTAQDKYGRDRGWAGGLLVNYAGPYRNSLWFLFGIQSPKFYAAREFMPMLSGILAKASSGELVRAASQINQSAIAARTTVTSQPPGEFVKLSADKKHFLGTNGKPLFLIGCNYSGTWNRHCQVPLAEQVETDFKNAHAAGINAFRVWAGFSHPDKSMLDALRQSARKYGIYLLFHIGKNDKEYLDVSPEAEVATAVCGWTRQWAAFWQDEPMVLGYDLFNEPDVTDVEPVLRDRQQGALLKLNPYQQFAGKFDARGIDFLAKTRGGYPPVPKWVGEAEARNLYAVQVLFHNKYALPFNGNGTSYSECIGATAPLPLTGDYAEIGIVVNATLGDWIAQMAGAIRAVDKNHLITVGYNTILDCLPANRPLDFVNHHTYPWPDSRQNIDIVKCVTTMDRLAKVWPDRPVTLGEFGCPPGIKRGARHIGDYDSAVGEMIFYLHSLSRGYDGCMKWMLLDLPPAIARDNVPWIDPADILYATSGMFWYDGTDLGRPRPICHATRFLREYWERAGLGGNLEIRPNRSLLASGYVFRGREALFVGDLECRLPELAFTSADSVNVMLDWSGGRVKVMATADATIHVHVGKLISGAKPQQAQVQGKFAGKRVEGDWLVLEMLEGEPLVLDASP